MACPITYGGHKESNTNKYARPFCDGQHVSTAHQSYGQRGAIAVRKSIVKRQHDAVSEDRQQDHVLERR